MVGEISRRALEMLQRDGLLKPAGMSFYVGRAQAHGRDRFCLADTFDEAKDWARLTEREMEAGPER